MAACTPLRQHARSFSPISQPATGEQGEVVAVAEVADAEHAALDLAEAGAEREVEALVDQAAHRVGVDAGRHDHAVSTGDPARRLDALDRQLPGIDRGANAFAPALMAREDVVEALAEAASRALR
jgi:hypothetical protein